MLFDDLSPYQYKSSKPIESILNVGWINSNNDCSTGAISIEFLNKLERLINDDQQVDVHFNIIRGVNPCEICGKREVTANNSDSTLLGMSEILIPDRNNKVFYASPSMVMHYIKDHNYLPPKCFIDSVLNFSFESYFAEDI
jgi:hypothetical protein